MPDGPSDGYQVNCNLPSPYDTPPRTPDEWLPMSYTRREMCAPRHSIDAGDIIYGAPIVPAPLGAPNYGDPIKRPNSADSTVKMTFPAPHASTIGEKARVFTSEGLNAALSKIFGPGNVPQEVLASVSAAAKSSATESRPYPSDTSNGAGDVMLPRSTTDADTHCDSDAHVAVSHDEREHIMHYIHTLCNRAKADNNTILRLQENVNHLQGHMEIYSTEIEQVKTYNHRLHLENSQLKGELEYQKTFVSPFMSNTRPMIETEDAIALGRAQMQPTVNQYYARAQHLENESHKLKTDKHKFQGFVRYLMNLLPTGKKDEAISALDGLEIDLSDETQDDDIKERISAARKEVETAKYWKQRALAAEQWMNEVL